MPAIVHNYQEGDALPVTVTMTATGLEARGAAPAVMTVPTGGEARTEWAFGATAPGSATLTGTVTAAGASDAMALTIPVHPFGARRDVGMSGSNAAGTSRTVDLSIPETSNPNARSVVVSLMPSMAGSLLGALDDLVNYPYGCTEQTVSSFVPNLLVMRTLDQLKLAPTERMGMLDRVSRAGLARLLRLQHENGAWGWWRTDDDHPFMTAYALYGLLEARAASLEVPFAALQSGTSALARQLVETPAMVPELKAYAAYVLARAAAADMRARAGRIRCRRARRPSCGDGARTCRRTGRPGCCSPCTRARTREPANWPASWRRARRPRAISPGGPPRTTRCSATGATRPPMRPLPSCRRSRPCGRPIR